MLAAVNGSVYLWRLPPRYVTRRVIGVRQTQPPWHDCAMLAGRPFLVCAGGPLP